MMVWFWFWLFAMIFIQVSQNVEILSLFVHLAEELDESPASGDVTDPSDTSVSDDSCERNLGVDLWVFAATWASSVWVLVVTWASSGSAVGRECFDSVGVLRVACGSACSTGAATYLQWMHEPRDHAVADSTAQHSTSAHVHIKL